MRGASSNELRLRLGLRYARGLREAMGRALVCQRERAPFASIADLAARVPLRRDELAALAEIGALASVPSRPGGPLPTRRAALWQAEAASRRGPGLFARVEPKEEDSMARGEPSATGAELLCPDSPSRGSSAIEDPAPSGLQREEILSPRTPQHAVQIDSSEGRFVHPEASMNLGVARPMSDPLGSMATGGEGFAPPAARQEPLAHIHAHPREAAVKSLRSFGEESRSSPGRPPEGRATSPLPEMDLRGRIAADLRGTGMTVGPHPVALERDRLRALDVHAAGELPHLRNGRRVRAGGLCIVRQRPGTAKGFVFLSLEDETGIANIVIDPDTFERNRRPILASALLVVEGRLEKQDGVTSVKGDRFWGLHEALADHVQSRDFH